MMRKLMIEPYLSLIQQALSGEVGGSRSQRKLMKLFGLVKLKNKQQLLRGLELNPNKTSMAFLPDRIDAIMKLSEGVAKC